MARERDPNRDKAKELYRAADGQITNREIAAQLGVDEKKVAVWKGRDNWDIGNVVQQKNKNVVQQKRQYKKLVDHVEKNEELTEMEKLFCLFYVQNPNATAAALQAGYSPNSVKQAGYNILWRPDVQAEIKRLKEMRTLDMMIDAEDVVLKYMRIAFADITEFVEFGRADVPVMTMFGPLMVEDPSTGEKKELTKKINEVRFRESGSIDGSILSEVKQGKDGASVKLADRMKALAWLGDYFTLNPMNKHKAEYDKRRLELEMLKVQASIPPIDEGHAEDDGFLNAMNGQAAELWNGGEDDGESSAPTK